MFEASTKDWIINLASSSEINICSGKWKCFVIIASVFGSIPSEVLRILFIGNVVIGKGFLNGEFEVFQNGMLIGKEKSTYEYE